MQILRCHIENFGKLSDFSMDFKDGCNVICSNNGTGKSTLAAFIRVMFYGFEGERKRKGLNERTFYNPWQGGVYGGELTFQAKGKTYTVSRVFGSKESEDRFELRNAETNSLCLDFSQNIGRELFEIDSESFMRTVFISGSDIDTETTGDINAKMGNLTDNTEDLTDYDGAASTIKDLLNRMDPNKKRGSIKQMKDRITQLEGETRKEGELLQSMEKIRKKIRLEKSELAHLASMKSEIEKTRKMTEKFRDVSVLIDQYKAMEERYHEAKVQADNAKSLMNGFVPNREELDEMQNKCNEMAEAKSAAVTAKLNDREIERFLILQQKFNGKRGELVQEHFDKVRARINVLANLRAKQRVVELSLEDEELLGKFQRIYGNSGNLGKETDRMENLYENYTESQRKTEEIERQLANKKARVKKESGKGGIINLLIAMGIILILTGCFVFQSNQTNGLWEALIGSIVEIFAWVQKSKYNKEYKRALEKFELIEESLSNDKIHLAKMEEQLLTYAKIPAMDQKALRDAFHEMRIAEDRFKVLEGKKAKADRAVSDAECMMMATEIAQFLNRWGVLEDEKSFGKSLDILEKLWKEYNSLRDAVGEFEYRKERYFEKKKNVEMDLIKMGIRPANDMQEQINDIRELSYGYLHKQENVEKEAARLRAFDAEYNINSLKNLLNVNWKSDLEEIDCKYEENRQSTILVEKHIEELERNLELLGDQKEMVKSAGDELLLLYRKKDDETKKFNLLKITGDVLANAKETLTSRYSKPLKARYDRYFKLLSSLDGEDYHIDSNGVLTVKEQGLQRQISSFSSGYKDMMGLCLRLAFIDVMYPDEKPPIILDDPFINLDKEKVFKGKDLLEKISEEYQVIYLTCNEDRK